MGFIRLACGPFPEGSRSYSLHVISMKLIRGKHNLLTHLNGCVVTLGNFDGLHLGHQALLKTLKQLGRELKLLTVVIIFEPQAKEFFAKGQTEARLMRFREKCLGFAEWKIDYLFCLRFDRALADLAAGDFVKQILVDRLGVKAVVAGDDCRFGAKRAGNYALLKQLGEECNFKVIEMPSVIYDGQRVSSTRVRQALQVGDMAVVRALLGRPYRLCGRVIGGEKRGRELGFPTANIDLHRSIAPMSGVFVVRVFLNKKSYRGVASLGVRPTFKDGNARLLLEIYLFDFSKTIYNFYLEVEFLHKLREEVRFDSISALIKQMHRDVIEAEKYHQILSSLRSSESQL
ncbi:bifunctional riboflavin kinase/FAD synthetase [Coxiella endosymbiont of Ornithodoros amblus]|uniref:bifunctional riboflavin kinase/FAD synthetase n=1 Tax=Coxiella endosymbiont of Ornithodoros amblus TaxID=1656166 RepID=UPI00244E5015|nr:bifunctional riboflavin kinase/FAD synthetase [Coxiella endosymbiont of Ornithodoros amblus]